MRVEGTLDAKGYVKLLAKHYIPWARNLVADDDSDYDLIFQQDNASAHTANYTKDWMEDRDIDIMPWPAHSPDFNPIENLWDIVDTNVRKHHKDFINDDALADAVTQEWKNISIVIIHNLIESMPRRMQAGIDAGGWQTKY